MTALMLSLALALTTGADPPTGRRPNPFAPSLPQLTDEEEAHFDGVIDRFIEFDVGQRRGAEGARAVAEFRALGPEAIPALIRGLNRAALIDGSCPALTIAKKLAVLFRASEDTELLEYARENIGAGVTRSRHMAVLCDLRLVCTMRKRALGDRPPPVYRASSPPTNASVRTLSTSDLVREAAKAESGPRREQLIRELEERRGDLGTNDIGALAADGSDRPIQRLARDLLDRYLARQDAAVLKAKLRDPLPEVRTAAARTVGTRKLHLEAALIDLLTDDVDSVRRAARQALVRLSHGTDFGPPADATPDARAIAARKWRAWLAGQGGE